MPYAEVIYETGAKSVVHYDSLDELKAGLKEHHRRAISGEPGSAQDQTMRDDLNPSDFGVLPSLDQMKSRPAERVHKVITYEVHPDDFNMEGLVHTEELTKLIDGMSKDGVVDANQLRSALRDEVSPVFPNDQGRHESIYKMNGTDLPVGFLESEDVPPPAGTDSTESAGEF